MSMLQYFKQFVIQNPTIYIHALANSHTAKSLGQSILRQISAHAFVAASQHV